jgi:zinc transport system permease protein
MVILDIIIVGIIFLLYKELLAISFDEEHASISGIPSTKLNLMIMCLIALTVVMLIRIVGMILVIALLTIPAAVSELFNTRLKNIIFHSVIISSIFAIAGLSLSYTFDLASGATIILIASITFFIAILIKNLCS